MDKLSWSCHICSEVKPDNLIGVVSIDTSKDYHLPVGTMKQNIRYCLDKQSCIEAAPKFRFVTNGDRL